MFFKGIALAVNDIDLSTAFYTDLLGLEVSSLREGHVIFSSGLHLYSISRWSGNIGKSIMDVYFGASSQAILFDTFDFDSFLSRLYKCSYADIYAPVSVDKGLRVVTILDPDKNLITIKEASREGIKISSEPVVSSYDFKADGNAGFVFDKKDK